MELLQYTCCSELLADRIVVVVCGHALLEQVDDSRKNEDEQPSDFCRILYRSLALEQLVANIILMRAHRDLLINQCTIILLRIQSNCVKVGFNADIVGNV